MPITPEHVGRSYPPTEPYQVTRGKIAEFAAALGDANRAYAGTEAIAPPTFAAVLASTAWDAMFTDAELGLALPRVMHTEQQIAFTRPLRAGDEVTATLTLTGVRSRSGVDMITNEVLIATTAGEEICRATGSLYHTQPSNEEQQ
ncbi:FAS1-like dehydratase domain-containing protein [Granulicoccus phenolivorans]|uniref:FAS1-like dehydratase domain-containing protein n=1 Tax=Granulicoccus phenolivorans TaxID=266854 RepID=UPI0004173ADA|nr:MaoC family dehydratase N-terminal domain-containing protein [Granulicoccus phenolivorans]